MTAPSQHPQRWYKISEVQLASLRKGYTHTSLYDEKGILRTIEEDQMIDCGCASHSTASNENDVLQELESLLMYLRTHPGETCQDIRDYIDLRMGQLRTRTQEQP
jgi:hypothetical protein